MTGDTERRFKAIVQSGTRDHAYIVVAFDPAEAWGNRERYHVTGTIGGMRWRGPLTFQDGRYSVTMGPAWLRDCPIKAGEEVEVVLRPEGAQLDGLDEDVRAVLEAEPAAARFFESLAQFYRKAYLTWLDGAKRRPAVREERLVEFISLLRAGRKTR